MTRQTIPRWRIQPTWRGFGILIAGLTMLVTGIGFASRLLTYAGITVTTVFVAATVWVILVGVITPQRRTQVERSTEPTTFTAGKPGTVSVAITPRGRTIAARMAIRIINVTEQATPEVTGHGNHRAVVERTDHATTLTYAVTPTTRGQWQLGPTVSHSTDPWGLITADAPLAGTNTVIVHPHTEDLSATIAPLEGSLSHRSRGAHTQGSDDAALREYRVGDDLRRVHWSSSARRGAVLVRTDETGEPTPATVIFHLPHQQAGIEWTISAFASVVCALLNSGHSARVMGGPWDPHRPAFQPRRDDVLALLDATVTLAPSSTDVLPTLQRCVDSANSTGDSVVPTVLVLCDPSADVARTCAGLTERGHVWALVAFTAPHASASRDALRILEKSGATIRTTTLDETLGEAWSDLMSERSAA
ncbi:DUF58 domain-containing protein [Demequina sediminicola]|uniref:DUF58 domain-containing protein n=1 Tax=Demequina sediminicola TaxID=1095026 RepID=UPI0007848ECA|nr:DUF58 domain-containing protein [Demequina sediminicola]